MDEMRSFDTGEPSIGIFWYNPWSDGLCGVNKHELTPMDIESADKLTNGIIEYDVDIREQEGLMGSVRWNKDHFEVLVGYWAKWYEAQLTKAIQEEFNLEDFTYLNPYLQ